jgi:hypothetical protein
LVRKPSAPARIASTAVPHLGLAGEHDDGGVARHQHFENVEPRHSGEVHVQEHQVGALRLVGAHAVLAGQRLVRLPPQPVEVPAQEAEHGRIIVDQQDGASHAFLYE